MHLAVAEDFGPDAEGDVVLAAQSGHAGQLALVPRSPRQLASRPSGLQRKGYPDAETGSAAAFCTLISGVSTGNAVLGGR